MVDKRTIDKLLIDKKIPKMEFYSHLGMTATGYTQMWEKDTMRVSTLKRIAEILEIPLIELLEYRSTRPDMAKENEVPYAKGLQAKLIECMEKKEALYERLVALEEERTRLLMQIKK